MAEMRGRMSVEKASGVAVTCNLLSQYLREKGALRDLGLNISAMASRLSLEEARGKQEVPRTINLLPGMQTMAGDLDGAAVNGGSASPLGKEEAMSIDPFPLGTGFGPADEKNLDHMREARQGQMTIFYSGKVMVFENFPAVKARELMTMAGMGFPSTAQPSKAEQQARVQPNTAADAFTTLPSNSEAKPSTSVPSVTAATRAIADQDTAKQQTQPAASDMPIARRVSLHRFLEKRKDRINTKAPYPVSGSPTLSTSSPIKPENQGQWLALAPRTSE